jgi:RNA recognition motif-containing protein
MIRRRQIVARPATLHVDHLPFGMTIRQLRDLFRAHGCNLVRISLVTDETGESKGHALVSLPSRDAEKAIRALDGYDLEGRALKVVLRKAPTKTGR